jgi:hypothetical protein
MATLTLQPEQPIRIALKTATPVEKPGPSGIRYLYVLHNGDGIYLPPLAHAEIQALRPEPGQYFTLGSRITQGNALEYFTEREQPNAEPGPVRKPPQTSRAISLPLDAAVEVAEPPSLTTPESKRQFRQLVATIEAIQAAEQHAGLIGRPVKFTSEDIRAMAISGFIEQSRAGKRYAA